MKRKMIISAYIVSAIFILASCAPFFATNNDAKTVNTEEELKNSIEDTIAETVKEVTKNNASKVESKDETILESTEETVKEMVKEEKTDSKEVAAENKTTEKAKENKNSVKNKQIKKSNDRSSDSYMANSMFKSFDFSTVASNKTMAYFANALDKGQLKFNLKKVRKDLSNNKLTIGDMEKNITYAIQQNIQLAMNQYPIVHVDDNNLEVSLLNDSFDDLIKNKRFILNWATNVLSGHNISKLSIYEKSKLVEDIVINHFEFNYNLLNFMKDLDAGKNVDLANSDYLEISNMSYLIKKKKAVCGGYSMLYQLLSRAIGLETYYVEGYLSSRNGNSEYHAWNWIKLDDAYYLVDTTWDDKNDPNHLNYQWFHMPISAAREIRGHDDVNLGFLKDRKEGQSFAYTFESVEGSGHGYELEEGYFTTTKETAIEDILQKIKTESRKRKAPFRLQFVCENISNSEIENILSTINDKLVIENEDVIYQNNYFEYAKYQ